MEEFLVILDDMAYIVECLAVNHTGEAKSELSSLIDRLNKTSCFTPEQKIDFIEKIETAIDAIRMGNGEGVGIVARMSRDLWDIFKGQYDIKWRR